MPKSLASARRQALRLIAAGCWRGAVLGGGLGLTATTARAGRQAEEPLIDSVRTALSAAVADSGPPRIEFPDVADRLVYLRWLGAMSDRLAQRKALAGPHNFHARRELLETAWYEAKRAGLEPALVLGLIEVESAFRKYAISVVGARGLMQVMPFWSRLIGDGDPSKLFHLQTNLRFGCNILRHYLDREQGDLYMALGRYNGSRGQPQYPNAVLGARRKWDYRAA